MSQTVTAEVRALLARFGSAAAALRATAGQLGEVPYLGAARAAAVIEAAANADVDAELRRMDEKGVRLLVLGTPEYPAALATIPDPSHLLYVRGTLEPRDANAVAVVGSRRCTAYGKR